MNRIKHLREERARIEGEMGSILATCEKEQRSPKPEETTKWQSLKEQRDGMLPEIKMLEEQEEIDQRSAKPVATAEVRYVEKQDEDKVPSLRTQIRSWMNENKAALEAIKNKELRSLTPMELRADDPMTTATLNAGASGFLPNAGRAPGGLIDIVRTQPTFWDRLTKGSTNLNPLYWVNKTNKQGNADFIGEGVLKPLVSFDFEVETSTAKKVAERMRVSSELLHDVPGIESVIRNEMAYEVKKHANDSVLTATASSTDPAGITTLASAFSLTSIEAGTLPSYADAIRAAIAQLQSLNFNDNIVAFINPIDAANMDLSKSSDDGHYLLPPFTSNNGLTIAGVPVVVDNNIAVGFLLVGDMSKYKIMMVENFVVKFGLDMDDFSKNLVTIIAEMRFHQFFSDNHTGAFIYDSFADIQAAITTT